MSAALYVNATLLAMRNVEAVPAIFLAILFAIPLSATAQKWASGDYHTAQDMDRVFEETVRLIPTARWGVRSPWRIQSTDKVDGFIRATCDIDGVRWGVMYFTFRPEGSGTWLQIVTSLLSQATHNPATYEEHFAKELKKSMPDLSFEIKRDTVPDDFAYQTVQMSIPLTPPQGKPNSSQLVGSTEVATDNSLKQIASSEYLRSLFSDRFNDAADASAKIAIARFLKIANELVSEFLQNNGPELTARFANTATAINTARNNAYHLLSAPAARAVYNNLTNDEIVNFTRQMQEHFLRYAGSPAQLSAERPDTPLHRALDAWYANGKDWTKIPPDIWNALSERDKGRLKEGVDPEIGVRY